MKLDTLKAALKEGDISYRGVCHDCKIPVTVTTKEAKDGTITIEGGSVYKIKQGLEELLFFKCDECFAKDHTLRNFRQCEVYSRVVGYLRPVSGYNLGKKEEYDMRKEYTNTKGL